MPSPNHMYIHTIYVYMYKPMLYEQKTVLLSIIIVQIIFGRLGAWCCMHLTQRQRVPPVLKTFENRIERGFPYDHLRMPTSALATAIHTCICMHIYIYICISYIPADWTLEPDFGNLPYPEKVTGTNRSDLGKIDKIYNIFYVLRNCSP